MLSKIRRTYQEHGLRQLVKKAFYTSREFDLFELTCDSLGDFSDITCGVPNPIIQQLFIPISLKEYERLGEENYYFPDHPQVSEYERGKGFGTIIFWMTSNGKFVHRTGLTTSKNDTIYNLLKGCRNYSHEMEERGDVAYAGFSETSEEFRRKGVYTFIYSRMYPYLKEKGFKKILLLEERTELITKLAQVQARFGAKSICGTKISKILRKQRVRVDPQG